MSHMFTIKLNARLQPMHRHEMFEDPLEEWFEAHKHPGITGGGSSLSEDYGVEYCDIEVELASGDEATLDQLKHELEKLGAPKGSELQPYNDGPKIPFGVAEGLALYLTGTELPDEVYENNDINDVVSEIGERLGESGELYSWWEGSKDTALYYYGRSFDGMRGIIEAYTANNPLCEKCRIVQIA